MPGLQEWVFWTFLSLFLCLAFVEGLVWEQHPAPFWADHYEYWYQIQIPEFFHWQDFVSLTRICLLSFPSLITRALNAAVCCSSPRSWWILFCREKGSDRLPDFPWWQLLPSSRPAFPKVAHDGLLLAPGLPCEHPMEIRVKNPASAWELHCSYGF